MLTHDELKQILDYDPETGIFRWKVSKAKRIKVGDVSGNLHHRGYRRTMIHGKFYQNHRLAWLYVYGSWPKDQIDHINGIRDDNRIENLREATNSENQCNKIKYMNNSSGFKGVSWHKRDKKWTSQIQINNKLKYLGYFNSPEEAYEAYCKAAKELHGEFVNVDN